MNILFLDQNSSLGGGQRVLLDLLAYSKKMGHDPVLMLPGEGYVTEASREMPVPAFTFPMTKMRAGKKSLYESLRYPFSAFEASTPIAEKALFFDSGLIFANGPRVFLPSLIAAKKIGIKVHLQLHLLFDKGAEKKLIARILKDEAVRSAVACSEKVFAPFDGLFPSKMEVVPYWVSPLFLREESRRDDIRRNFELKDEDIAVGVIGRISPTKGQKLFLKALLPLLDDVPNLGLLIAGSSDFEDESEEGEVRRLAAESSHKERIKFTGMIEGIDFYDGLDILVVPSIWEEPFGLVSVEGMARNLPVVATRSGALAEIVDDGVTGFVVPKNENELREAVKKLVSSRELREKMGKKGKERVLEFFNPEIQIRKVLEIALNEH